MGTQFLTRSIHLVLFIDRNAVTIHQMIRDWILFASRTKDRPRYGPTLIAPTCHSAPNAARDQSKSLHSIKSARKKIVFLSRNNFSRHDIAVFRRVIRWDLFVAHRHLWSIRFNRVTDSCMDESKYAVFFFSR